MRTHFAPQAIHCQNMHLACKGYDLHTRPVVLLLYDH